MKSKTPKQILTLAGIMSFAVVGIFGASSASALGDFTLPGFEDWQYPWSNRSASQINYNIIDGAGDGAIAIKKVDENGNPLANAKFKIDGVTALYVNGKYIYSEELGLYSEFTTDKDGLAIVSGLPFGTYKVTETAAPEGYELDPQTYEVVVNEENMAEVEYGRKLYRTSDFYQEAMDLTDYVATSPEGRMFVIEIYGEGMYLNYNPDTEAYSDDDNYTTVKKTADDKYMIDGLIGDGDPIYASRANYGESLYAGFPRMSDIMSSVINEWVKDNGDGTITVHLGNDGEYVCTPDGVASCATPDNDLFIQRGNGGYFLTFEDGTFIGAVFEYDETLDKYVINPTFAAIFVNEIDEDTVYLHFGFSVNYSSVVDRYMFPPAGSPLPFDAVEDITGTISAASLTVTNDSLSPEEDSGEDAINPQTSDAIMKVALLGIIGALPILIARKELKKR